jgi:hypothetical protein
METNRTGRERNASESLTHRESCFVPTIYGRRHAIGTIFCKIPNPARSTVRFPDGLRSVFLSIAKPSRRGDCQVRKNAAVEMLGQVLSLISCTQGKRTGHESLAAPFTLFVPVGICAISPTGSAGHYGSGLIPGLYGAEAETATPRLLTPSSQNDTSPRRYRQKGNSETRKGIATGSRYEKPGAAVGGAGLAEILK